MQALVGYRQRRRLNVSSGVDLEAGDAAEGSDIMILFSDWLLEQIHLDVASLFGHAAVLIIAVAITVASIERNNSGQTTTTLVLGEKQSKESESFDPHQLADLGETGVQSRMTELPPIAWNEPPFTLKLFTPPTTFMTKVSSLAPPVPTRW